MLSPPTKKKERKAKYTSQVSTNINNFKDHPSKFHGSFTLSHLENALNIVVTKSHKPSGQRALGDNLSTTCYWHQVLTSFYIHFL